MAWQREEGVRFAHRPTRIWATATTSPSNGSVNSMSRLLHATRRLVPLFMIQLGEVSTAAFGSGLYGMLIFAIVSVFRGRADVGGRPIPRIRSRPTR